MVLLTTASSCKQRNTATVKAIYDSQGRALPMSHEEVNGENVAWWSLDPLADRAMNGIGNHRSSGGCTISFIATAAESMDSPPYFITSGHCFKQEFGPHIRHFHSDQVQAHVYLNRFKGQTRQLHIRGLLRYATLTGTDLAIVEGLTMAGHDVAGQPVVEQRATYGAMLQLGYHPLRLSDEPVQPGDAVTLMQIPIRKGSAEVNDIHLRGAKCRVGVTGISLDYEYFPNIHHGVNAFRHRCSALGGSSGSPMFNGVMEVVGLHTNSTDLEMLLDSGRIIQEHPTGCRAYSGGRACEWFQIDGRCIAQAPCEVRDGTRYTFPAENYSVPTAGVNGCFVDGKFAFDAEGCGLNRP